MSVFFEPAPLAGAGMKTQKKVSEYRFRSGSEQEALALELQSRSERREHFFALAMRLEFFQGGDHVGDGFLLKSVSYGVRYPGHALGRLFSQS